MARNITWRSDLYESDPILSGVLYFDGKPLGIPGVVEMEPSYNIHHNWNQGSGVKSVVSNIIEYVIGVVDTINQFARKNMADVGMDNMSMGFGSQISKTDIGINYKEYGGSNYTYNIPEFKVLLLPKDDPTSSGITNTPMQQLKQMLKSNTGDLSQMGNNLSKVPSNQEAVLANDVQSQIDSLDIGSELKDDSIVGSQMVQNNILITKAPHNFERIISKHPEGQTGSSSQIKGKCRLVVGGLNNKHYYTNLLVSDVDIQFSKTRLYSGEGSNAKDEGPSWIIVTIKFEQDATDFKLAFKKHLLEE